MSVLPARPNLEHLKKQAKALLHDYQQRDPSASERFRALGITTAPEEAKLADAQHVIARDHGYSTWSELKDYVESLAAKQDPRKAMIAAVSTNDVAKARALFERYPVLRETINDPAPELPFGGRPIGAVATNESREMVDLFLEYGADINLRSEWAPGGFGVLDGANPEFAEFLISRGARLDAHSAAHLNKLAELRDIVATDPNVVHARGGDGQTPLHFAKSFEIADFLLAHGADIDAIDVDHEGTPAQWMISDRTELARYLVRRGAKIDILMAIALGDIDLVRRYLDADPGAVRTTATKAFYPVRGLLAAGHIYQWSLHGHTAHQIANDFGHENIWQLLMERSPDDVRFVEASRSGDEKLVREILEKNPDLTRNMPNAMAAKLVDAVQEDNLTAVRTMLDAGWPTDGRGQEQATPLHWAGFLGNAVIARELLRYGAAVNVSEPTFGGTPVTWTLYGSVNGWRCESGDFVGVLDALLKAGATLPTKVEGGSDAVRDFLAKYTAR
ncbi:MAG: ankyrin repeat domain-containing protein [Gemmatimonadaceae bacterium]